MKVSMIQLQAAIDRAALPSDTFEQIHAELTADQERVSGFEIAHISYYLGALLIIGAMGWFITNGWDRLPGSTIMAIAVGYGILFGATGSLLFQRAATRMPGGLLTTVAICMTPLAVYGLERTLGWWPANDPGSYSRFHPYIHASWVLMEVATIAVAGIGLWFTRFSFITAPAAYALWYLSMDATAWFFGTQWNFHQECRISIVFGLGMLVLAYLLDGIPEIDLSFWFYLFGLLTVTGGLTLLGGGNQLAKAIYCLIHLAMIPLAVILQRRVFLVFGAIGVFSYLMGEATGYFRNSLGFTFSLTAIGVLFIAAGIAYKRNEKVLATRLSPWVPARVRHRHICLV
jgi:hypothetical protein